MNHHYLLSDLQLEKQMEECTLDPSVFTHTAHLRLAWIYVQKYGIEIACSKIANQIKTYTESVGAKDKYNKTVTIAAVRAVNHFYNRSKSDNFIGFIKEFPRLKTDLIGLLGCHYSYDIIKDEEAMEYYREPDLLAF